MIYRGAIYLSDSIYYNLSDSISLPIIIKKVIQYGILLPYYITNYLTYLPLGAFGASSEGLDSSSDTLPPIKPVLSSDSGTSLLSTT